MQGSHAALPTVAVLGGGTAGVMVAAHLARSREWNVDLLEASSELGGLHKSPMVDGVPYDIGAFIFGPDHDYFSTFPGLLPLFVPIHSRAVSLRSGGVLDTFPLSVKRYLRDRGPAAFMLDLLDLARCKVTARRRATFRDYCRYYLGGRIYERTGLRSYVERLYALPDSEIGLELARGRLAELTQYAAVSRFAARALGLDRFKRRPTAGVIYARPRGGFQQVYQHIGHELEGAGVRVVTDAHLRSVRPCRGGFRVVREREIRDYRRVISTIPMQAAAALRGLSLPFVPPTMQLASLFYRFRGDLGFDATVLYNYSSDGAWKRLTLFSQFYGALDGDHYFSVECTAPQDEVVDLEARRRAFEAHVHRWPVFRGSFDYRGGCVTPNAYPVYRAAEEAAVRESRSALAESGMVAIGRQGRFEYTSSAAVAADSRKAAASLRPKPAVTSFPEVAASPEPAREHPEPKRLSGSR